MAIPKVSRMQSTSILMFHRRLKKKKTAEFQISRKIFLYYSLDLYGQLHFSQS